ncbi:MAG: DUF1329 domain-containing protein, partial [Thermodesulfobacteriota bacterium]|nr:DUF1329 domain-containing protein [Thermodesulfobacteriota bacterium]
MEELHRKNSLFLMIVTTALLVLTFPGPMMGADIPSVMDVIKEKAPVPAIEDLTGGKVKIGDLIDKNNVDLVKEYVSAGIHEAIRQGMVMRIGQQIPREMHVPDWFRNMTKKNKGKAVIDENGTCYYEKMGVLWPGGLPFLEPRNGLEVLANVKYGVVPDDFRNYPNMMILIDSKGKPYKTIGMDHRIMYFTSRKTLPPIGAIPGYEEVGWKKISVMTSPHELKGLGQYNVRYYDDSKYYDTGFAYLPAFKRTIRISSTTWQDNIGGSDLTYGDGQGLQEPYSDWSFELVGVQYMLLPEPKSPFPVLDEKGRIDKRLEFDINKKYPRLGWAIWPVWVVEATPRIKHIYGKKILHVPAWPYWTPLAQIKLAEIYDKQMKLWKFYLAMMGDYNVTEKCVTDWGLFLPDLQTGHMSQYW